MLRDVEPATSRMGSVHENVCGEALWISTLFKAALPLWLSEHCFA